MLESATSYTQLAREQRRAFLAALPDAARHQARVLRSLIEINAGSRFGREHGFDAIADLASFRRAVPLRDHAALAPWLDASLNGEPSVLTAEPPLLFVHSSGSTGTPKQIPWTRRYVQDAFLPWFHAAVGNTLHFCPEAIAQDDSTLNLKWDPRQAPPSDAPTMGASQVDFAKHFGHRLAFEPGTSAPWAAVPAQIADELERIYYRVRLAVESDLRAIVGINPAIIAALPELLRGWRERIVDDLRRGTVVGGAPRAPNPRRADQLETLARTFGTLQPRHIWPNLRIVYCWTGGPARIYIPRIAEQYGSAVRFMPAPIAASEGVVAVPIDQHPSAGPLVVSCVLYEFIDADRPVNASSPTLAFDELRDGGHYHVILSHVGGMYRYVLGDIIRVVDHVCDVPRVEYAGRYQPHSVEGENIDSYHLVDSLGRVLRETHLDCGGAAWRIADDPLHYELAIEVSALDAERCAALAHSVDRELQRRCPGYAAARADLRLAPLQARRVAPGAFVDDWKRRVASGVRPAQVKDRVFIDDPKVWRALVSAADGAGYGHDEL